MLELPSGVIDPSSYGSSSNTPTALLFLKRAHERFEEFKELPFLKGLEVEDDVNFHRAYEGIISESKKHNVDLYEKEKDILNHDKKVDLALGLTYIERPIVYDRLVSKRGDVLNYGGYYDPNSDS